MKNFFSTLGVSVTVLLILSISVKDKPLFSHIYTVISPGTQWVQGNVESLFSSAAKSTQAYSKKLFDNSIPKIRDSVKSKSAAPVRAKSGIPEEAITKEEKARLDDLIKSY